MIIFPIPHYLGRNYWGQTPTQFELRFLQKKRSVQLKYGRLATAIDMWIDDGLFDTLTHLQINKAQKRIARAITQVENIRRKLRKLL